MLKGARLSDYNEQFPAINDLETAASSLLYLGKLLLSNTDLRGSTAKEHCLNLLENHPEFYSLLKDGHLSQEFRSVYRSGESVFLPGQDYHLLIVIRHIPVITQISITCFRGHR